MIMTQIRAKMYCFAPMMMPMEIAQKRYIRSTGSLTTVRKRTMESAPTMPSDSTGLAVMVKMMMVVMSVMRISVILKLRLYATPL